MIIYLSNSYIVIYTAGLNVRIGIYRPPNGGINDFVYLDDDTVITWSDWNAGQPDMTPTGADYAAAYDGAGQSHTWYDNPNVKLQFVCEL